MSAQPLTDHRSAAGIATLPGFDLAAGQHGHGSRASFAKPGAGLIVGHAPGDARAEEICALRTEILLRNAHPDESEVLALVSPCAREGRSQLAAELAIAFAQLGRPTLLVDADLRHPVQHRLFVTDNDRGLGHAIEHGGAPYLHPVESLPQMFLVTAGVTTGNPLEALLHGAFPRMIAEWRRSFAFIVLDTSPVTPFSDALAVASVAGRVLALSRARHTPFRDTRAMLRRLTATRAQVLGGVISHF